MKKFYLDSFLKKYSSGLFLKMFFTITVIFYSNFKSNVYASDYFWVGGTGNWSDISHWATSSGGVVNYLQVPTAFDDVYFDSNSFTAPEQSVTVNAGNYVCHNLNWSGVQYYPTFKNIMSYPIKIYGSLILSDFMNYSFLGVIYFEATDTGHTIKMSGNKFKKDIYFQGIGGGWSLQDEIDLGNYIININNGNFNSNNQTISCGAFSSTVNSNRTINLGSSIINTLSGVSVEGTNLSLNAGTSVINISSPNGNVSLAGQTTLNDINFISNTSYGTISSTSGLHIFNNVVFNGNSYIIGNNTFNDITLKGIDNILKDGCTQTIVGNLFAEGNCASPIYIHSSYDTVQTTIKKDNGTITLDYVYLKSVKAEGGAIFSALNSCDMGNNTAWDIIYPVSRDLFWVGNSGNWDDPSHWALTSGGVGGACIPSPFDDVYFDANSFSSAGQSVTVVNKNAFCRSMSWIGVTNTPSFNGSATNILSIYGSLRFASAMNMNFLGYVYFKANTSGNVIQSSGQIFKNCVYFDRYLGGWYLLDPMSTLNVICLIRGSLNLNSQNLSCAVFYSDYFNQRELFLTNSTISVTSNNVAAWYLRKNNLIFDAVGSVINFTNANGGMYNTGADTIKYYNVNFLSETGTSSLSCVLLVGSFNNVSLSADGIFSGNMVSQDLSLLKNNYQFESGKTLRINNHLIVNASCSSLLNFYSSSNGNQAYIAKYNGDVIIDRIVLRDISLTGNAIITANNAIDLGNNSNWIMNLHNTIDLYWVGYTGNWNDPSHWSLTSGGVGGACIPTPLDNVYFDANSFNVNGQNVTINVPIAYCRNMDWSGVTNNCVLKSTIAGCLNIFGSLSFSPLLTNNYTGPINFESKIQGNTILSSGKAFLNNLCFNGVGGSWLLLDDIKCNNIIQINNGYFKSDGKSIITNGFQSPTTNVRKIDLGTSDIKILASASTGWSFMGQNLVLNAKNTSITFTTAFGGMTNACGDTMNYNFKKIIFADTLGTSCLISNYASTKAQNITFMSNGAIYGNNTFDTLNFYPSKTYILESSKTQTIKKLLNMSGNGCFPITIRSSSIGVQSSMYKSSGIVSASFIDMRDQNAYGGAAFYVGNNSTDIGNNSGWVFGNAQGLQFGLPDSAYVCPGDTLWLNTYNFIGGVSFKWQDGSYGNTFPATHDGKYWVEVTYADRCFLVDTIQILLNPAPSVSLSNDTSVCNGTQVTLFADGIAGSTYHWSENSVTQDINVTVQNTTMYYVSATNVCGTATDSVLVSVYPMPFVDAGNDIVICHGQSADLNATGLPGSIYLWENTVYGNTYSVAPLVTTTYHVSATDQHSCGVASDEITVYVMPVLSVNAGVNISVCLGEVVSLQATTNGTNFLWSTGEQTQNIIVAPTESITYFVTVSDSLGCSSATDDVTINIIHKPNVDAGADIQICEGKSASLTAFCLQGNNLLWSTGENTSTITVTPTSTSIYTVTASNDCGYATDQVTVFVKPFPEIQINVADAHCNQADGSISLNDVYSGYIWSTGETTPLVNNLLPGTYNVSVNYDECSKSEIIIVNNIEGPKADFYVINQTEINYDGAVIFFDQSSGDPIYRRWNFGDSIINENTTNPTHNYNDGGQYVVTLYVKDEFNCFDSISNEIIIKEPNEFFIPNAFTPDGDGLNDGIGPVWTNNEKVEKYHMLISDRWGKIIFETENKNELWLGQQKENGQTMPDGIYTYLIEYAINNDKESVSNTKTGLITLLGNY